MPTDTIIDLLNVGRVRKRRSAVTSFFLLAAGAYMRSTCGFLGVATVNTFSSVNQMKLTSLSEYFFSNSSERTAYKSCIVVRFRQFLGTTHLEAFQSQVAMNNSHDGGLSHTSLSGYLSGRSMSLRLVLLADNKAKQSKAKEV